MSKKIAILPGDGIGQEIMAEAAKVIAVLRAEYGLQLETEEALIGGAGYEAAGKPLPDQTLALCRQADAVLFGAVGGPAYDNIERSLRPERGLLALRSALGVFANIRPATLHPELAAASSLKPEVVSGLDIIILRELTGDVYFGEPRGIRGENGQRVGFNSMVYRESEIERIAHVAFQIARQRKNRLCSVDKANVLETSELWRAVMVKVSAEYPDVELGHMYVDNAAMQLVRCPKQFDVIVTGNIFGDILSDISGMLTGSIGMLPSASLDGRRKGLYEPIHGSAPDIAGKGIANPLGAILSLAMLLRYTLTEDLLAHKIERAVDEVLRKGLRTRDIANGRPSVGTAAMGDAVATALRESADKTTRFATTADSDAG